MTFLENETNRFGSAAFSGEADARRAGLFDQRSDSLLIGFIGKRPIFYSGAGGLLLTAGARGGKLRDLLAYNLCVGIHTPSMLVLDMKGELAAISQDQTADSKHCIYWNPAGLHDLPQMSINPVDYVRIDSPSLISDVKVLCHNLIPPTANKSSDYFEGRAREFLEGIILTLVRVYGSLTLGQLYSTVNLIPGGGDAWLDFAFEMNQAGFEVSARIEEEIANARNEPSGTGYQGILGELFKALSCLSDPTLLKAVSPPFDFSIEQLCDEDQSTQLYIMPPAEFIAPWAPVIKAIFVAGMIYKARKPQAPRQTWVLDECAQLGGFPLVTQLFTYGAGIGIRPWAVFQSIYQMDQLGKNAGNIITSSAQVRSYFTIRDVETATNISRMLGVQTLEYDDEMVQARARHAKHQAVQTLLGGGDPFMAGLNVSHHQREAEMRTKQQRLLRTPDEVMHTPSDKQFIFMDDLPRPLYADRKAYFEQTFMAGRYHPNPYHPPLDRVQVKTRWGHAWRSVVTERVSAQYAAYPQYQNGQRSRVVK
ncbi:MAG: type IV secretory system conjugative DNA transfer family protein [Henriciella sp.]|nr:type IV secretory system conjugative DNA transfer family protein [Henriciella sp.]